ncbi:hypothetical protein EVAR_18640_1 [Eumeta japonica]|uniref:Uncharacterized protein n=1 Tax=Eumeta variegata TaxID=151549 RepID=A0A4C1U6Q8_EUMVA|nr:hypothetical protein EVAR_18640_1 [Eumeta japonica]
MIKMPTCPSCVMRMQRSRRRRLEFRQCDVALHQTAYVRRRPGRCILVLLEPLHAESADEPRDHRADAVIACELRRYPGRSLFSVDRSAV